MERDELKEMLGNSGPEGDDAVRQAWTAFVDRANPDPDGFPADAVRDFLSDAAKRGELTEEMCLAAVAFDGDVLDFVPERFRTREVCTEAVANAWTALSAVPDSVLDAEICADAVVTAAQGEADFESPAVWAAVPQDMQEEVRSIVADRVRDLGFDCFDGESEGPRP